MGAGYYAFALFITGLICLIAILCKVLFSNVKQNHKLLDEKETKLLQLYQTVESIMDDFGDQAGAAIDEMKEYERRAAAMNAATALLMPEHFKREEPEKLPRAEKIDPNRMRAASEMLAKAEWIVRNDALKSHTAPPKSDNGDMFRRLFDEAAGETPEYAAEYAEEPPVKPTRSEMILSLAEEGKTEAQIAKELGITQNEVKLVIELKKKQ